MKTLPLVLTALFIAARAGAYDRAALESYNALYKNGDYQAALEGYRKIAAAEPDDPYAWYNAGNAYFRLNDPGRALADYAKAFRLLPRDTDIRANLELTLRQTGQAFVPEGVPRALHYVYYFFSDAELKSAASVFWWLACLLISLSFLRPALRPRLREFAAAAGLLLAAAVLWAAARSSGPFSSAGVVTAEGSTPLLSGPGDNFKTYASLPQARLVKILDDTDTAFYEVGMPREGIKGWVRKTSVEPI